VTGLEFLGPAGHLVEWLAKRTLVATLFLIGSGLALGTLQRVGLRTFLHGVTLWILVAAVSLCGVIWLYMWF